MMDLEKIYILHEGFSMILNFSCLQIKDEAYRMNLFFFTPGSFHWFVGPDKFFQ